MRFGLREAIFILLLLAMPVAAYFFVFQPRNQQIHEAQEEIRAKQAKLKQLEAATRNLADLGKEIDKLGSAIEIFERKLPAQREEEVILRQVWEMAARNRLVPKSVRTDKPSSAAQYSELPIRMSITGEFEGFYSFLLEWERLPRVTRMPKLQIKTIKSDLGGLEADLTLTIFFDSSEATRNRTTSGKDRT